MSQILVVDDDSNNQRMLSYSLRKAGYEVLLASDGQAGLDILDHEEIHLAIIDLSMPVMDGISMLRSIRTNDTYSQLPVIVLTASGDENELFMADTLGVVAFLTKPTSSRILLKTVANILQPSL
jgi:DNA-binding response OmpR family regulator